MKLPRHLAVLLALGACTPPSDRPGAADTIFFGGDILTMEGDSATYAEAVAVDSGRIVFVGSKADALAYQGKGTVLHDLKGQAMMPGFIDPHLHPILGSVVLNQKFAAPFDWVFPWGTVPAVRGHAAFMAVVKAYSDSIADPATPLTVWGYSSDFHGGMSRKELDGVSTTRPIMVWQYSAHEMFFNTAALKHFGLSAASAKGNSQIDYPRGRYWEAGFFTVALPTLGGEFLSDSALLAGMGRFRQVAHLGGLTTIGDMALGSTGSADSDVKRVRAGLENDSTPFRVQFTPDLNTIGLLKGDGPEAVAYVRQLEGDSSPHIFVGHSIKLFSDGAFFGQAFQVLPPGYKDGHHGEWIMPPDRLAKTMKLWWDAGYTIHIHCNGSGGLAVILDALEQLEKDSPRQDHRLTIEHFGQSSPEQAARIAALGAVVSANPYYLYAMGDIFAKGNLGEERASELVRLGSLRQNHVTFGLHSDFTMAPMQPLLLAWIAANRITAEGTRMGPDQRVPVYNALQGITSGAAYVLRLEDEAGSIAPGKRADFVLLAQDPMKIDPMGIKDIRVLGTVFGGKMFVP